MHIYKITNKINFKVYVGKTECKKAEYRWSGHKSGLKSGIHKNKHLQAAWNKYGEENFTFEVIEQFDPEMNFDLSNLEKYWIEFYGSKNPLFGYNKTAGGEGIINPSEETRQKMSLSRKGKPVTEETRQKISEGHKGKIVSIETREKISNSMKGKPGRTKGMAIPSKRKTVVCVNNNQIFNSLTEAAIFNHCSTGNVSEVCNGKRNHIKGFQFKFTNKE